MNKTTFECFVLAGVGGMMPTLSKFGASMVADPSQVMPAFGFYVGLGIYFFIGAVIAYAFAERNLKQAFLAGIAAPAIIASTIAGVSSTQKQSPLAVGSVVQQESIINSEFQLSFISSAYADDAAKVDAPATEDSKRETIVRKPDPPMLIITNKPPKYRYSLLSMPTGSSDWREQDVSYRVTLKDTAGETSTYQIRAFESLDINVMKPILEFNVEAGGQATSFSVLNSENKGGQFVIRSDIETRKDLFWALGAKGQPVIRSLDAQFIPYINP